MTKLWKVALILYAAGEYKFPVYTSEGNKNKCFTFDYLLELKKNVYMLVVGLFQVMCMEKL